MEPRLAPPADRSSEGRASGSDAGPHGSHTGRRLHARVERVERVDVRLGGPIGARLPGVDVARAFAIIGMMAVHVGPTDGTGVVGRLYASPFGRASLLFVLVAGVGVTLLARSRRATLASARVTLLWRAALLLPIGVLLQQLDHGVNVILQAYALLFVVAAVVLASSSRVLISLAAASTTAGPFVYWWGRSRSPGVYDRSNGELTDTLPDVLHTLVLSGPYPLVTWLGPLLIGMWLGRQDLEDRRLQLRLVAVGAPIAVAAPTIAWFAARVGGVTIEDPSSPWSLTIATPHSQMPLWLWGSTAAAVAILGGTLWVIGMLGDRRRSVHWPLVATGQLAFTVYVGHLVALAVAPDTLRSETVGRGLLVVAVSVLAAIGCAVAWRSRWRRGPLEWFLQAPRALTSPR